MTTTTTTRRTSRATNIGCAAIWAAAVLVAGIGIGSYIAPAEPVDVHVHINDAGEVGDLEITDARQRPVEIGVLSESYGTEGETDPDAED